MKRCTLGVVGNPNCGKTTLFNALTGARQRVGNWPGVTVDKKTGEYTHEDCNVNVIDTPGIYSLSATSVDEKVARDFVVSCQVDLIINIVDASNLERNLYLTSQLLEMGAPLIVALNMMDIAHDRQIEIDINELSRRLGCPVIPMVIVKNKGVEQLKQLINETFLDEMSAKQP
jgi:ferrous iron transport protein B